ncbi:2-oxoacid:acceptor oxidoreductase family protein [Blastochloris viridis]|nr:2-oxoacid:acceptor oxidoreductase family protein [Blastochloris viridis]CUU44177.1 indolepyruvate oxidoreductase subunit beta [Blastochloris viridis]
MTANTALTLDDAAPAAAAKPAEARNIMIVGVGGQGVLMISKVMALMGQRQGLQVKQSEVHGMAKRGGIVFSHVRFGSEVWSPTIAKGEADALIALEWAEGLRWLDHLKPDSGVFIADTRRIVPPFACRSRKHGATTNYARETPAEIVSRIADGYALDATTIADDLGDVRAANTVLLGTLSVSLDYPVADWLAVIEELVPKRTRDINRKAFEAGRAWAEAARLDPELRFDKSITRRPAFRPHPEVSFEVEVNEAWCKGCDICVKLCPERCLAMSREHIATVAHPEACTGCHVCEWLCPDFAISVKTTVREPVSM